EEVGRQGSGTPVGRGLKAKRLGFLAGANLDPASQDYGLEAQIKEAALVIVPGDGDGFLKEVMPADGLRMNFDLVLGWSNRLGFHFSGSAGLEAELPINVSIGPVSIQSVHLAARAGTDGIRNEI